MKKDPGRESLGRSRFAIARDRRRRLRHRPGEVVAVEESIGVEELRPEPELLEAWFAEAGLTGRVAEGSGPMRGVQRIRLSKVIRDEQVDPPIRIEVGRDHAQPPPVRIDDARLGRHVDEPSSVVAEQVVAEGLEFPRVAVLRIARAGGSAAKGGVPGIPGQVMTDI